MSRTKFTPDPEAPAQKRAALAQSLEDGFQRVQSSDGYRAYLDTLARFHNYSINNTMLIWMQKPHAQRVAGFKTWLSLGRHVRKGEKSISILAPMTYTKKTDDEDIEEAHLYFRPVPVFDISQTEGEDLPEVPIAKLNGDDDGLFYHFSNVASREQLTISRDDDLDAQARGANGYYNRKDQRIWVDPSLAPRMAAKTLCHELAHHFGENISTREEGETMAESVAYLVLGHFGIDAGEYSFGYLAAWSDAKTFRAKLTDIHKCADLIIGKLQAA